MAKIIYEVTKNTNSKSLAFGKWYGRVKALETLNTRKMAQHIARNFHQTRLRIFSLPITF